MKLNSKLTIRQVAERASNKVEAQLFFAYKKKEELELKLEGVIPSKLDTQQICESMSAQNREIDVLLFMASVIEEEQIYLDGSVKKPITII